MNTEITGNPINTPANAFGIAPEDNAVEADAGAATADDLQEDTDRLTAAIQEDKANNADNAANNFAAPPAGIPVKDASFRDAAPEGHQMVGRIETTVNIAPDGTVTTTVQKFDKDGNPLGEGHQFQGDDLIKVRTQGDNIDFQAKIDEAKQQAQQAQQDAAAAAEEAVAVAEPVEEEPVEEVVEEAPIEDTAADEQLAEDIETAADLDDEIAVIDQQLAAEEARAAAEADIQRRAVINNAQRQLTSQRIQAVGARNALNV